MLKSLPLIALAVWSVFSGPGQAAQLVHNNARQRAVVPRNEPTGYTTKAAVAYYYTREGVDRSKNVSSFTNPTTGAYCITPSIAVKFSKIYPHVTVEYEHSAGSLLWAYWSDSGPDCPSGSLEVLTVDSTGNFSPDVAFIFTVE